MKMRILFFSLCILTGVLLGLALAAAVDPGPAVLVIDGNREGQKVPAFPHRAHQESARADGGCQDCHHATEPGEKPVRCTTCHQHPKEANPDNGAPGFIQAFHDKCLGCHRKQTDRPELKKCKTCHPKEKQ